MTIEEYANLLTTNLIAACPKDTRNLARNITLEETENEYIIVVGNGVPYARGVNYNWGERDGKSKASYNKRGLHKEKDNYLWVERTIEATSSSLIGKGSVSDDL